MSEDAYWTIAAATEGLYKEKGSKFIAYAWPVQSISDVQTCLEEVKQLHPKARHHCYAYRLGIDGALWRANDDGEPSGTAGRPILGQIQKSELSDLLVVVVRYFGGTLLGASGLIRSYKNAAADALSNAQRVERVLSDTYTIQFDYPQMGAVMAGIERMQLPIENTAFDASPSLQLNIRKSQASDLLLQLRAAIHQVSTEQAEDMEDGPGWSIVTTGS